MHRQGKGGARARGGCGVRGRSEELRAPLVALHTVGQITRALGNRDEFTGAEMRITMRPADASVEGVLQRPLSTGASLLQRAGAALVHPAQGTGVVRVQLSTVVAVAVGARTRRATRPRARVNRSAPGSTSAQCARVLEKFRRASSAACRDELWSGRCRGWRCVRHARCRPCALDAGVFGFAHKAVAKCRDSLYA